MEHGEDIEIQLWAYIDGTCDATEMQRISALVATAGYWQNKYNELLAFHNECIGGIELEQPSMRFTKNVMESLTAAHVAPATGKYINPAILKGIAAFFIISIFTIIIYAFSAVNWTIAPSISISELPTPHLHTEHFFSPTLLFIIIGLNVVIGLVLMDMLLRRKTKTPASFH